MELKIMSAEPVDRTEGKSDDQKEKEVRQRREAALERALEDSFPASDPISPVQPASRENDDKAREQRAGGQ
jgi:hypothetical protein